MTFNDFQTFVTTESGRIAGDCVGCDGPGITRTVRLNEWPCRFSYDFDYPVWRDPAVVDAVIALDLRCYHDKTGDLFERRSFSAQFWDGGWTFAVVKSNTTDLNIRLDAWHNMVFLGFANPCCRRGVIENVTANWDNDDA